jgi:Ca2+-binding EF-hand superfamily protein
VQVSLGTPTPAEVSPELEANATKLFTLMDANGNGFVVQKELERHLSLAGIYMARDRVKHLYDVIRGPGKGPGRDGGV